MSKIGVLVAQLGTPDAPTPQALRRYLKQFLSDKRVVDYPAWLWQPILRGILLRTRPAKSVRKYQRIWMEEGSPLLVYSRRQVTGLQQRLGNEYRVILGMTYGNPSIRNALQTLEQESITRIVVLSMYPQYSSATTASVYDAVYRAAVDKRFVPALHFIAPYYAYRAYIQAMANHIQETLRGENPDLYLFTFHGIPQRYVRTGDPYPHHCEETAKLLAVALNLEQSRWMLSFQSQFGPESWLQPYTSDVLKGLHQRGIQQVAVFAPGFTADCLETLDELGNEGLEEFKAGGGRTEGFRFIPCLNDYPRWLDAMAELVR